MRDSKGSSEEFVVVALDGSPAAAAVLPLARVVADQLGARVQVVQFVDPGAPPTPPSPDAEEGLVTRYETGDPVDGILRVAGDPAAVLVVLPTHGHEVSPGRVLAPIPTRVVAEADRPILLARPDTTQAWSRPLKRFLIPVDGTPSTTAALKPAMELAGRLGACIDVLYVVYPFQPGPQEPGSIAPPRYVDQPQHDWPAWRAKVEHWLRCTCEDVPRDAEVDAFLARGLSSEEIGAAIAAFAADHQDDAIVLVRRSRLDRGRAQILRHLLDHAPCPVLIIPGPFREVAPGRDIRRNTPRA